MKNIKFLLLLMVGLLCATTASAKIKIVKKIDVPDSLILDDPKPRVVTGGLKLGLTTYNMIVKDVPNVSSNFHVGNTLGGFLDFKSSEHTFFKFSLMGFYYNCSLTIDNAPSQMSNEGMSLSFMFFGTWDVDKKGNRIYVGAGPYTEFVLGCQLRSGEGTVNPFKQVVGTTDTGDEVFALHDSYSGITAMLGFEFHYGMQIELQSNVWSTDLLGYDHKTGYVMPFSLGLSIGYRFK